MSQQQLLIPSKIKVGYNLRNDTYTGQLAYIIYYDGKGVLRKEKSWQGWRNKSLGDHEFENTPTEGFVLNKGVGGNKHSYGWHTRNEKIRVYDPRNFEFEITVANLLFILRECNCSKGKGLEGKFVYAWDGQELALLPESCEDFQHSQKFTKLQDQKVVSKDLIPGASYITKKQEILTFVGRFDYHFIDSPNHYGRKSKASSSGVCKKYVFWTDAAKQFVYLNELKNIAALNSDQIHQDYAKFVTKYANSAVGSKAVSFTIKSVPDKKSEPITPTPGERSLGQLLYETLHGQVEGMKPLCGEPYARLLPESIARYEHAAAAVVSHASKQREFYDIDAIVDMLDEAVSEAESTPLAKPDAATKWPRYFESKDARHDKSLRRVYHADGTCGWQDGNGSPMSTTLSEALQDDYMIETDADGNELKQPIAETKPVVANNYNYNYFYVADPSEEGSYIQCRKEHNNDLRKYDYEKNCYINDDKYYVQTLNKYKFVNGLLTKNSYHMKSYPQGEAPAKPKESWNMDYWRKQQETLLDYTIPISTDRLYAKLESGKEYPVTDLKESASY